MTGVVTRPRVASCQCGLTFTVGDGFGAGRCPTCDSFLADHEYSEAGFYGNDPEDVILRCTWCDGRPHSHGRPYVADRTVRA